MAATCWGLRRGEEEHTGCTLTSDTCRSPKPCCPGAGRKKVGLCWARPGDDRPGLGANCFSPRLMGPLQPHTPPLELSGTCSLRLCVFPQPGVCVFSRAPHQSPSGHVRASCLLPPLPIGLCCLQSLVPPGGGLRGKHGAQPACASSSASECHDSGPQNRNTTTILWCKPAATHSRCLLSPTVELG